jgi:hypothetical protein
MMLSDSDDVRGWIWFLLGAVFGIAVQSMLHTWGLL